jgi:hypothetical protein
LELTGTHRAASAFFLRFPPGLGQRLKGGTRIVEDRTMPIMWLSLISIATAASIGLSVAAIVVQTANQNESLNN